ncbi:CsgE family curli-type amyloid fiber assembly protein [Cochleicola gelatinilyticus]|uniref:Curli production assembly/transport component CsgE n=1 Tax=Cochleicola gelatinilyticus TaxID=1763537 RepID=A0A167ERT5_9FLAO|nr:CsgE family curli-type amyloid fiber assembly protein [Cochleicola gelatinilyticus]OAB75821.1 hypothetical protein ULVI_15205 [Cochleicola gelatinilyticus]
MKRILFILILLLVSQSYAQFYNVEIIAKIKIEKNSEFLSFTATAENTTPSDYNLQYDFMMFRKNENDSIVKTNQEERFYIKANEKKLLSTVTVGNSVDERIILVLLLYDKDKNPIGQDRIVLGEGGKTELKEITDEAPKRVSLDQAAPEDGFIAEGYLIENTITKAGRDFFRIFSLNHLNKQVKSNKNIIIEEVPGRGRSTRISVKVEERLVWQFFAQPKKKFLEDMADKALYRCIRYLQALQNQESNFIHY